ncbi:MAG: hypothetical protein H7301_07330 [Cryobacterium sp.]|nr:hypothetical protein [Oligoflexia bacterium]
MARLPFLISVVRILLTAAVTLFSLSALAAKPRSDDLLLGLPPAMRSQILAGASDDEICHYRILEKEMKIKFRSGAPATNPRQPGSAYPCSSDTPPLVANIASAEDLKNESKRVDWLWSTPAYCEYKKQLAKALERAALKLKRNPKYGFLTEDDVKKNRLCSVSGPGFQKLWSGLKGSYCVASNGDSAAAMQCFYGEECRLECGGGAVNLLNLGAYELFAGADGIMDEKEAARFNREYPNLAVGPFTSDPNYGIQGTQSPFFGSNAKLKATDVRKNSRFGEYGMTGFRIGLSTNQDYQRQSQQDLAAGRTSQALVTELNSNAIVISTSKEGAQEFASLASPGGATSADQDFTQLKNDSDEITKNMAWLTYLKPGESYDSESEWLPYDQITATKNSDAIIAGTYRLRNATDQDQKAYARIQAILSKPMYRDTKIYIHPHGELSLAKAILDKKKYHYDFRASMTLLSLPTSEASNYGSFLESRVDACLGK